MKTLEIARQLAKSLAESSEYQKYKSVREKLDTHEAAKVMVEDFHKKQWEYEQKRMNGDKLLEPLTEELRKLSEIITINPYAREYLMAEYEFSKMMMDVQNIIGEAVGIQMPSGNPDGNKE
jgi:cell fate (sporulation/competence/biofilm development) regulator YlbF (YheA/YmcA/DUF963 family)